MTVWHKTPEYMLISAYYGDKTAQRSGVPLMNHIREGIKLLIAWGRPETEQRAFAIHPIIQNGGIMNFRAMAPSDSRPISEEVLDLAGEYKIKANAYLCRPENDHIKYPEQLTHILGDISEPVAYMLLADKVQNQKDFRIHHWFTHDRATELERYFNLWISTLKIYYL